MEETDAQSFFNAMRDILREFVKNPGSEGIPMWGLPKTSVQWACFGTPFAYADASANKAEARRFTEALVSLRSQPEYIPPNIIFQNDAFTISGSLSRMEVNGHHLLELVIEEMIDISTTVQHTFGICIKGDFEASGRRICNWDRKPDAS